MISALLLQGGRDALYGAAIDGVTGGVFGGIDAVEMIEIFGLEVINKRSFLE